MRTLFVSLFCFLAFSVKSQTLNEKVWSEMMSLRQKGVDTIIRFDNAYNHSPSEYIIKGLGDVMVIEEVNLFYKLNGQGMMSKCIYYGDSSGVNMFVASLDPLKTNCNSLVEYASDKVERFTQEQIFPFIYKVKLHEDSSYALLRSFHESNVRLEINFKNDSTFQEIALDGLDESMLNGEIKNLNYAYNSNTSIYKIWLGAWQLIEANERKFTYGSNN